MHIRIVFASGLRYSMSISSVVLILKLFSSCGLPICSCYFINHIQVQVWFTIRRRRTRRSRWVLVYARSTNNHQRILAVGALRHGRNRASGLNCHALHPIMWMLKKLPIGCILRLVGQERQQSKKQVSQSQRMEKLPPKTPCGSISIVFIRSLKEAISLV
jgi:hypothetical protein